MFILCNFACEAIFVKKRDLIYHGNNG